MQDSSQTLSVPSQRLIEISKRYRQVWPWVENMRAGQGKDLPRWPAWCFLPISGWYALVSRALDADRLDFSQIRDVASLAALGTWRYSQGIYRFHPDFYDAVLGTLPNTELPVEVFYHLPEWCVYLETPRAKWLSTEVFGFWCHLEWDVNTERHELRLLLNAELGLIPIVLHLGDWTVIEAVDRAIEEARHQATLNNLNFAPLEGVTQDIAQNLGILSLVLYLCSSEPEILDERSPEDRPAYPHPKRTKKGLRLFAPEKPRIWTVGAKTGASLNAAREDALTGRSVMPHLRRAHWHGYWTGPRDAEREFIYRWLSPILVAGANEKVAASPDSALHTPSPRR